MRVVVLCAEPEAADQATDSIPSMLRDLGCDVVVGRFDVGDLNEEELARTPATVVVVDAGDELERASRALPQARAHAPGVRAAAFPRAEPRPRLDPRAAPRQGLGLPLLRRLAHRRH